MSGSRVTFCHVPWRRRDAGGVVRRRIMAIPTGVFGLASLATRLGHAAEIVHVGLEELRDSRYRLESDPAALDARVIAFDLHWHPQLGHVLESARRAKQANPSAQILVGGLTASVFHDEIMRNCPWVDLVIRGEAEGPLEALLRELASERPELARVPNLSWRSEGRIRQNPLSWCATQADLDAIELDLGKLRHHELYDGAIEHPAPDGADDPLWGRPRTFHVVVGRGCTKNCAHCGGARQASLRAHGRGAVVLRSPERVETELHYLVAQGFHTLYFAFDPPGTARFYLALFARIASSGPLPGAVLEHYDGLPSDELIAAYARAFREPTLVLSPGSAVPELRARHALMNPDNAELEDAVRRARAAGLAVTLYFTLLPGDDAETLRETADWMSALRDRHGVRLQFASIEVEPGSAWHREPESFGIELERKSFEDFVRHHTRGGGPDDVGYRIRDAEAVARVVSERIRPLIAPSGAGGEPAPGRAR